MSNKKWTFELNSSTNCSCSNLGSKIRGCDDPDNECPFYDCDCPGEECRFYDDDYCQSQCSYHDEEDIPWKTRK